MTDSRIRFGVDYYPEHWPESRWPEDARLMEEANFNVVRLAEFAWSRLEPAEGEYDFGWLDRIIEILSNRGMDIVLGTPTASAPPWLMNRNPDAFRVREDGQRVTFGNRRNYCPNHPGYHERTRRIVEQMAGHYADNEAVIGWQVDNEFGDRCYCTICVKAFREWLWNRYESIDDLNEKWGTVFWSHIYNGWDEISVPLSTGESPNPALALDFYRFASDSYVRYQQLQLDILRERCPEHFMTHNFMGFKYDQLDYFKLARPLDLVTWDNYLRQGWNLKAGVDHVFAALQHDAMRGLKDRSFWVMEAQSGPGGWENVAVSPRPGEIRLWAYQAIAHGADGIVFFRWRTARFGTEQYWHGILDHHGQPGRRYREVRQMGRELASVGEAISSSSPRAEVALVSSYDSRFAFQIQGNNPAFSYPEHLAEIYRAFHDRRVAIDVVPPEADLSRYKLVLAPALHVLPAKVAENLQRFVEEGGVLFVTPRTGVKGEMNEVVEMPLPGLLAEVCGVVVEEYDSLPPDTRHPLKFVVPELESEDHLSGKIWCDVLSSDTAEVVAYYTRDYYADKPAVTLNRYGRGRAIYLGTMGNQALYGEIAPWMLNLAGVTWMADTPEGVEVSELWRGDERMLFVINYSERTSEISLNGDYVNLFDDSAILEGSVSVTPRDVLLLREEGGSRER